MPKIMGFEMLRNPPFQPKSELIGCFEDRSLLFPTNFPKDLSLECNGFLEFFLISVS